MDIRENLEVLECPSSRSFDNCVEEEKERERERERNRGKECQEEKVSERRKRVFVSSQDLPLCRIINPPSFLTVIMSNVIFIFLIKLIRSMISKTHSPKLQSFFQR